MQDWKRLYILKYILLLLPADAEKLSMLKRKKGFSGFSDVSNSSWMYKYVMKIATLGFAEL
ncbi:hypothetical protein BK147_27350 [Paenibacillus sp. FSL R7-0337]|nr:hypothetical protein C162_28549 [Paenibacillus sp. FSL R7-269]OMF88318.1 hypothetical protein BK147_27350 [Paenibacillus sp. FSL R7-0337]